MQYVFENIVDFMTKMFVIVLFSVMVFVFVRELMIRRIYPYTRIFVRSFGEYSILPSREYAAKTLL